MELTSGTMAEVTTELDWMRKVTKNPETMRMRSAKKVGVLEICLNKQADRNSPSTTAFSPRTMMAKDTMNIAREEKRMITPMVSSARSLSAKRYLQLGSQSESKIEQIASSLNSVSFLPAASSQNVSPSKL